MLSDCSGLMQASSPFGASSSPGMFGASQPVSLLASAFAVKRCLHVHAQLSFLTLLPLDRHLELRARPHLGPAALQFSELEDLG